MSAYEVKEQSEREELLSDVNAFDDQYQMEALHEDPLVEAAIAKHKNLQNENDKEVKDAEEALLQQDIDQNTFCIPKENTNIKCGISWSFLDENKAMIDLDLIVTALDIWSFELDSVNKNHKKMFKKSVLYNKNKKNKENKDDKLIQLKLDEIPENCHSLWFIINAYSGDSLKDVDKAAFHIYSDAADDDNDDVLYSYDVGMGFDCGAILLGILYRSSSKKNEWQWTIVEEKNLYANLIKNNLHLIYSDDILAERANDLNVKYELNKCNERYIIDGSLERVSIGIGWDFAADDKKKRGVFDIDIDVDGSLMVFSIEKEQNDNGEMEEICEEIDIVNSNNNFYKTYVQYVKNPNHLIEKEKAKDEKKKLMQDDDDDNNNNDDEANKAEAEADDEVDDEVFDIYVKKMNGDNDVGSLCVVVNIFNDNNMQNKNKTNNINDCYIRLFNPQTGREMCRYTVYGINEDKQTCALVLCYFRKLRNGCWYLCTNDVVLKSNSNLNYQQYAKEIVLGKYSDKNKVIKNSCCIIL